MSPLRVGFAAVWDDPPEATWSYTPWSLMHALAEELLVEDLGPHLSGPARATLKAAAGRRVEGTTVSLWRSSRLTDWYLERALARSVELHQPDVVLEVLDIAPTAVPFVLYQDMSWRLLQRLAKTTPMAHLGHVGMSHARLARRAEREADLHEQAAGVAVMSDWVRTFLVRECGMAPERVEVVRPGCNVSVEPSEEVLARRVERHHRDLLFVGRDFERKAGDVVVEAVRRLRDAGEDVRLTVVGPDTWPLAGEVPDGVRFLGRLPRVRVRSELDASDLFVMPSRFEAYGIAFAEALSAGVPCIGRDACAMPEIIEAGKNGALVRELDPDELAAAIASTLGDPAIYEATAARAASTRAYYSWTRAARDMAAFLLERAEGDPSAEARASAA